MPQHPLAWEQCSALLQRIALGRIPTLALGAIHSARVLALDRPEANKVRPLALGNLHRRLISKAITKTFTTRIQEALGESEYSLGANGAAEGMHKAVLIDLDQRPNAVKASFDISNAHNEFCRESAVEEVKTHVPAMLPWLKGHFATKVAHVYLGEEGTHHTIEKSRGGDQGDAVVAVIFPLVYRRVTLELHKAAAAIDPESREYTYQDDVELICNLEALEEAQKAFGAACAEVKLRANLKKTTVTLGRNVDPTTVPTGLPIEQRAIVLKHGGGGASAVPAQAAPNAAEGSLLAEDSPELRDLEATRARLYERLTALREGGLTDQQAFTLLRTRVGGDATFLARACGIPAANATSLDRGLEDFLGSFLENNVMPAQARPRTYLRVSDGGLGMHSISATAPAANAASWHKCIPHILKRLELPTVSALTTASPWCAQALPICTEQIRIASCDPTAVVGDADISASQRTLASAPLAAAAIQVRTLVANGGAKASAALRSAGGPGSAGWLSPPPPPRHPTSSPTPASELPSALDWTWIYPARSAGANTEALMELFVESPSTQKEDTRDRAKKGGG